MRKQCDCCGEYKYSVAKTLYCGIETYACGDCRDDPEAEDDAELEAKEELHERRCICADSSPPFRCPIHGPSDWWTDEAQSERPA